VLLEAADVAAAAAALDMGVAEFIQAHAALAQNRAQLTLKESPDGACEFLGPEGACRIYAARPRQCRDFPHRWRVAGCPGLGPREI
jgi:Fe-S-cluster containining protein